MTILDITHLADTFILKTLKQLGVKCFAQRHIGVSQWIRTQVSHTKGM